MEKLKTDDKVQIRAFLDPKIKAKAYEVLKLNGLTYSDVINDLFIYIATTKEIPFKVERKVVIK